MIQKNILRALHAIYLQPPCSKISSYATEVFNALLMILLFYVQAYTGELPTPETLRMRKESRSKILKAQGYYLPDPDAKKSSPTVERIK